MSKLENQTARPAIEVGLLAFDQVTQLDLTGPFEALARVPMSHMNIVARTTHPVTSDTGFVLTPTVSYADCPPLDVICVPGGPGVNEIMLADETLSFLRDQATNSRYVTSVCSGALILGAADLLRGYRATTHWASLKFLARFGAIPVMERVCVDRNRITGGGVTAGIDFGLYLAGQLAGVKTAQRIQLYLEYAPKPPFDAGTPESASEQVLAEYSEAAEPMMSRRAEAVERAAVKLEASMR